MTPEKYKELVPWLWYAIWLLQGKWSLSARELTAYDSCIQYLSKEIEKINNL